MKKSLFAYLAISLAICFPVSGQKSGFLKNVTKSVSNVSKDVLGTSDNSNNAKKVQPEPSCASDLATVAMDLGGSLQLDYQELTISILSDGRILAQAHGADEYYIAKDGVTTGPYKATDPKVADFIPKEVSDNTKAGPDIRFKPYVTKSGEKYLITFAGKKYGPYAVINDFSVTKSKDKFAAFVTETVVMTEDQGKKMEEAMKNAKDDQERMELAMQYSQQISQAMADGGGPSSITPKLVTNFPNITHDPNNPVAGTLNSEIKYDDIVLFAYDKINNLQGKTILTLKGEALGAKNLYVNSTGSKYAFYTYGKLTFSDNTSLTDLFNTSLVNADGKVYLSYMYYSPKRNAIMQHKIDF
jgi:hypothetical protein